MNVRDISKIQTLIAHIENEMQSDKFLVKSIDWILALWEYERKDEKSIHKEYADAIIGGLRRIGFDIVPDYEIDKKRFNFGDICVIYKNEECHSAKLTTKYERSDLFIKLASRIVNADKVTDEDFIFVEQYLQSYNNTVGNHLHLMATIRWRFSLKKQAIDKQVQNTIGTLTSEQRTLMGNALIRLACINGDIHPKRIDDLKKVLPLLGIDVENIHSQIHRLLTDSNGFAVIEKKSDATEFTINGKSSSAEQYVASHVTINQKKLRTLEQQTKVAREILSDIFAEEEAAESKDVAADNMSNMWMDMLKLLFTQETWKRVEIEDICKKRGLMLGAVLEQINDYAYEKVDDAVVEDDGENIYVTLDYKNVLL
ncbi:MAG: tellurite resistance TerB C-terminal domain-containing protein [Parabacteroides sp.]|nr:tellurite resistance TerB C-terminal domain-containing protein [Parabacteroides sp.]